MAVVIDNRLLDPMTVQDVTENFNRVLALIDTANGNITLATGRIEALVAKAAIYDAKVAEYDAYLASVNVTVSFNSDGGTTVTAQTISYGTTATEPDNPSKEGYTFSHWELDEEEFDFTIPVKRNITLTAIWTENTGE
jgi:uncharacterized repeat protein (TIGR02543 family)